MELLKAENLTKASRVVNRRHATHALLVFPSSPSREHRTVCRERAFDDPRLNNPLSRVQARKAFAERTPIQRLKVLIAEAAAEAGAAAATPSAKKKPSGAGRARGSGSGARGSAAARQREQRHQRAAPQEAPARRWRWRR